MTDFTLSASILSADFSNLKSQLLELEKSMVDWVHVDVMDGHFAPNITMGPFIVDHCRKITDLPIDVHLMIEKPEKYVDAFMDAGSNYLCVHYEGNPLIQRTLNHIREKGCHPGIAITPSTPPFMLESILENVDYVLVMTVNPGFSGQAFQQSSINKISKLKQMIDEKGLKVQIQVDGGINANTLPSVYQSGARIIVAATAIFGHPGGIAAGVNALRNAVVKTKIAAKPQFLT